MHGAPCMKCYFPPGHLWLQAPGVCGSADPCYQALLKMNPDSVMPPPLPLAHPDSALSLQSDTLTCSESQETLLSKDTGRRNDPDYRHWCVNYKWRRDEAEAEWNHDTKLIPLSRNAGFCLLSCETLSFCPWWNPLLQKQIHLFFYYPGRILFYL